MDGPDLFGLQPIDDCIADKGALVEAADPSFGSDPEVAGSVFEKGANAEVAEAVGDSVVFKRAGFPLAHSFVGTDPDAAVTALEERPNEIVHETLAGGELLDARAVDAESAVAVGSDPEHSIAVAKDISHFDAG